ncbi:hypothetical protein OFC38_34615, partial [Escherichia coli]|nr:hypothetical protein [Escherichia coli]
LDKVPGRAFEGRNIGAAIDILEAIVEATLQLFDGSPMVVRKGSSVSKLVESVESFDQKV